MKGKNKKLLWFEAGVLIITLITFSISSFTSTANSFKNPPVQPTDIPWIDLADSYEANKTGYLVLDFNILYGTPPYTGNITWGDGSPSENFTTPDGHVLKVHRYETCRSEAYRLTVWATDSDGDSARAETDVFYYCCEVELSVTVTDDTKGDYPFHCENEPITFTVTVTSAIGPKFCVCDQYKVILTISSRNGSPNEYPFGSIRPGETQVHSITGCQACGPGIHTVYVTVVPIGISDHYPDTDHDSHQFYIFSKEACFFLKIFYDLFSRAFNSIFPNNLYG
jgi:hypothetical protein